MDTNTSITILVIILSTTLAIALILTIVLLVKLVQISNAIKRITVKAEEIADKAEAVTEFFGHASGPVAVGKVLSNIVETVNNWKRKKD